MNLPPLTVKKNKGVLTVFGWIVVLGGLVGLLIIFISSIHSFLSPHEPLKTQIMVVEGWLPDYALEEALQIYRNDEYKMVFTVGGPLELGFHLAKYSTWADLAAATLKELGMNPNELQSVPSPSVKKDRTFSSALALKQHLKEFKLPVSALNLVSLGPHSRRSRLLFQIALGNEIRVGVIPIKNRGYDPSRWWIYSEGVRQIISEFTAYLYARLFFAPNTQASSAILDKTKTAILNN